MADLEGFYLEVLCVQNIDAGARETGIISTYSGHAFKTAALCAYNTFDYQSSHDVSGQNTGIEMISDPGLAASVIDAVFKR